MGEGYRGMKTTSQTLSDPNTVSFLQWNVHCWVIEKQKHFLSRQHFTKKESQFLEILLELMNERSVMH